MSRKLRVGSIGAVLILLTGCEGFASRVYWGFERMIIQPRFSAFGANPFFIDGRAMRPAPEGAIARGTAIEAEEVVTGTAAGQPVDRIPVRLDRAMLERGRSRYDIYCAPCHGILGNSVTPVATRMLLRPPPSLQDPRIRALPPGRVYQTVTRGYGLMPGYEDVLTIGDRWAVVAYVQALQLSQSSQPGQR